MRSTKTKSSTKTKFEFEPIQCELNQLFHQQQNQLESIHILNINNNNIFIFVPGYMGVYTVSQKARTPIENRPMDA